MSNDIAKMNDRQLRNEVQLLRDELAIMMRKYEDILYNLDDDNFSSRIVREKKDMKTAIEVTAEGIKSKVSKEDLNNALSYYSTIEQTADKITATVTKEYVTNLVDGEYVTDATLQTQFNIYANGIYATVEENYETKDDASDAYSSLSSSIASVSIEADSISSRVESVENGEYGGHTLFRQTSDTFLFDGDKAVFTGCVYLTDSNDDKAFSIFLQEEDSWNYEAFYMWGYGDYTNTPLILGTTSGAGVYIGNYTDNDRVATRGWVLDNAGSGGGSTVAKFG